MTARRPFLQRLMARSDYWTELRHAVVHACRVRPPLRRQRLAPLDLPVSSHRSRPGSASLAPGPLDRQLLAISNGLHPKRRICWTTLLDDRLIHR